MYTIELSSLDLLNEVRNFSSGMRSFLGLLLKSTVELVVFDLFLFIEETRSKLRLGQLCQLRIERERQKAA